MTHFKGKIYYYKNINGEEKKLEKEFDDEKEFEKFAKEHKDEFKMPEISRPRFNRSKREKFEKDFNKMLENETIERDLPGLKEDWKALHE